jgi:hypothetical protein
MLLVVVPSEFDSFEEETLRKRHSTRTDFRLTLTPKIPKMTLFPKVTMALERIGCRH